MTTLEFPVFSKEIDMATFVLVHPAGTAGGAGGMSRRSCALLVPARLALATVLPPVAPRISDTVSFKCSSALFTAAMVLVATLM